MVVRPEIFPRVNYQPRNMWVLSTTVWMLACAHSSLDCRLETSWKFRKSMVDLLASKLNGFEEESSRMTARITIRIPSQ